MSKIKVSLIASANRPQFFKLFLKSLLSNIIPLEVIFAGPVDAEVTDPLCEKYPFFRYIKTADIKPAQCYEIARREATGELLHWTADDCEYEDGLFDEAYADWKDRQNPGLIFSLQTRENYDRTYTLTNMNVHRFFGGKPTSPLMAPLALIDRVFVEVLGGFDRRYICGQYENDVVMNAYEAGGICEIWSGKVIDIDHLGKHGPVSQLRPFSRGYNHDRIILETSWQKTDKSISATRLDKFELYQDEDILIKSQSFTKSCWI